MWPRGDCEDGYDSSRTGSPAWLPGPDSAWHSNHTGPSSSSFCGGRRHSTVSDSGDTGIGTYCSDSVEDDSSSSTTPLSFQALTQHHFSLGDDVVPSSSSPSTSIRTASSPSSTAQWSRSSLHLVPPSSHLCAPGCLNMRDHQPIRRCSSLTKLSSGTESSSAKTSGCRYNPDSQGSLDRGVLHGYKKEPLGSNVDLYLPLCSPLHCHSLLQRSPGAAPCCRYNRSTRSSSLSLSSALSSPVRHSSLDMSFSASAEDKQGQSGGQVYGLSLSKQPDSPVAPPTDRSSPIQPALRTQMWLTEQMEYRPRAERGSELCPIRARGTQGCSGDGLSSWQQGLQQEPGLNQQMLMTSGLPVNSLVKVKEGLLRQRELEINRQKQQILQLHARIRENELRAQQVLLSQRGWFDHAHILNTKEAVVRSPCSQLSDRLCADADADEQLGRKLAVAELEVLHLNQLYKQVTHKYTEDIRKLQDKIKTRDRYISSLKKKCQRESEHSQEKQERIETLEKYLCDLPTLEEVQAQAQQEQVEHKARGLEQTVSRLQKSLDEGCALIKDKDMKIELQAKREDELMASVHSLQMKVQQCLDDGVRLPVQDLKQLEEENTELVEQQELCSRLVQDQKQQIERLSLQLTAARIRLQKKRDKSLYTCGAKTLPWQADTGVLLQPLSHVDETPEVGGLLKDMSLCLLDLQALCSILAQRAQGEEPNLSLLLGMKSLSVSAEESGGDREVVKEELRFKLLEVAQLRRDIDELRKSISDRYAQYMSDTCVSQ
ncbi:centrosomal protein of 85 kDa-like isoform X3 [Solea solea]|uniref:centrosomal protein of 85 kDa-like isoform X3 n=1 Tax=Solea solea TaxID=90069 RepID=UPI00272D3E1F|nr:centrosomal protein of 85 kDa-like isoform X3 [Solea solea]